jgi:uncharacterized membrane protein
VGVNAADVYRMTLASLCLLSGGTFVALIGLALEHQRALRDAREWAGFIEGVGGIVLALGLVHSLPSMLMGVVVCMRERRIHGWVGFLFVFWFFGAATVLLLARAS